MWKFILIVLWFGTAFSKPNTVEQECDPELTFTCENGRCIDINKMCDYNNNCGDNSDEPVDFCNQRNCTAGMQRCPGQSNYQCIDESDLCDGFEDCKDNSDELPENCPDCNSETHFTCANKRCVRKTIVCGLDHISDDGVEDRECSGETHFRCNNGNCLRSEWRCDEDDDCGDNSDELNCEYEINSTEASNADSSSEAPKLKFV